MEEAYACDNCDRELKSKGGKTIHMKTCLNIKKKEIISATIKDAVWRREIGSANLFEIKCPICRINIITSRNFQCGHILARARGGCISVNNLRPICGYCNSSMGSIHMDIYIATLWYGRELEY